MLTPYYFCLNCYLVWTNTDPKLTAAQSRPCLNEHQSEHVTYVAMSLEDAIQKLRPEFRPLVHEHCVNTKSSVEISWIDFTPSCAA